MTSFKYRIGSKIKYQSTGGDMRTVIVEYKSSDIKNGRPGFDGVTVDTGYPVWGYDSQIVAVVEL